MSRARVLITGGAGFIGSHVGRALLEGGYRVRALDMLTPHKGVASHHSYSLWQRLASKRLKS